MSIPLKLRQCVFSAGVYPPHCAGFGAGIPSIGVKIASDVNGPRYYWKLAWRSHLFSYIRRKGGVKWSREINHVLSETEGSFVQFMCYPPPYIGLYTWTDEHETSSGHHYLANRLFHYYRRFCMDSIVLNLYQAVNKIMSWLCTCQCIDLCEQINITLRERSWFWTKTKKRIPIFRKLCFAYTGDVE